MPNTYFEFKQFTIQQDQTAMKVTTDACLFGAWVAETINTQQPSTHSLLDIGAGTGLLSLMAAQKNPSLQIDSVEIDRDAYIQAKQNIETSPFNNSIRLFHEDILDFPSSKRYDIIISNPPFYENELRADNIKKNTAHHDEGLTLDELSPIIKKRLSITGSFYLLLPFKRNKEIPGLFRKNELYASRKIYIRPSIDHQESRIMIEGSLTDMGAPVETTLDIRDGANNYTPAFIELLRDYYLKL